MEGIITKGIGGFYYVKVNDKIYECRARGKFRAKKVSPAVGDRVTIKLENEKGVIDKIHKRDNLLLRPTIANVSRAFIVMAIRNPNVNIDLLNKFLVLCEYNEVEPIVVFNKIDLVEDIEKESIVKITKKIGYEVIFIKAKEGYNIHLIKENLRNNISIFCGPSGAGKSTLFNKILGTSLMEIGDISEKLRRGKHTTRYSQLIEYEDGYVVDTPGFSSLEFDFISHEDLKYYIKEFTRHEGECKFTGCNHINEPKCKIKELVEREEIAKERYDFYASLFNSLKNRRNKKW